MNTPPLNTLACAASALALFAAPAAVGAQGDKSPEVQEKPDDAWISVSGTAKNIGADDFTLDYGEGSVTVEADDWDWTPEAAKLKDGERITVYGYIDDDLYERRSIEASSIFRHDEGEFVYADSIDEEGGYYSAPFYLSVEEPEGVTAHGDVESVNGREFVLDVGTMDVRIDTLSMAYNPLDEEGYQKVDVGDRVSVIGDIEESFFDDAMIDAESILVLRQS